MDSLVDEKNGNRKSGGLKARPVSYMGGGSSLRKYSMLRLKREASFIGKPGDPPKIPDVDEYKQQLKEVEEEIREEVEKALTPEELKHRKKVSVSSLGALFFINLLLLCAEAVLPTYIEKKYTNARIPEETVSLILA